MNSPSINFKAAAVGSNKFGAVKPTSTLLTAHGAFSNWFAKFISVVQVARMASAIGSLNDRQLTDLGIERSDIQRHAETLVLGAERATK